MTDFVLALNYNFMLDVPRNSQRSHSGFYLSIVFATLKLSLSKDIYSKNSIVD